MNSLFGPNLSISETKKALNCSEQEAYLNLEKAAKWLLKNARWYGFTRPRIKDLQKPLLQLKLARKKAKHNI